MSERESEDGGWQLWAAVIAVFILDLLVRRADLSLWLRVLILMGAVLLLNRLGIRGWLWRVVAVALLLSTIVSEMTTWALWPVRLGSLPVAWLLCVAAAVAREVLWEPLAEGWREGAAETEQGLEES